MNGPVLSSSGPANSHLELTGLFLGSAGGKGWCLGAWEPSPHASPSPGCCLWEASSPQGTLPKSPRCCSIKMRGTEFVCSNASPAWQPAEPEPRDAALFAQCSLRSHGEQPGWGCSCPLLGLRGTHVCSSRSPPASRWDVGSVRQPPAAAGAPH